MITPFQIAPRGLDGPDWTDLAVLTGTDCALGRAVRRAQRYFSDEELSAAIEGRSRDVLLTIVDDEPVFLNAAMITDLITDYPVDPPLAPDWARSDIGR